MGARVLVVEDDPITRSFVQSLLQSEGMDVFAAGSVEEALTLLQKAEVHLVLLDLQMPGKSGVELATLVRSGMAGEGNVSVPIIALTGSDSEEEIALCEQVGMNGCMGKPFNAEDLVLLAREWCGTPKVVKPAVFTRYNLCKERVQESPSDMERPELPDPGFLARKFSGDLDFIRQLVETFQADVKQKFLAMKRALAEQNWKELERDVHSLKGAAGVLELRSLREKAAFVESLLKKGNYLHIEGYIKNLEQLFQNIEFSTILKEIECIIKKGGSGHEGSGS